MQTAKQKNKNKNNTELRSFWLDQQEKPPCKPEYGESLRVEFSLFIQPVLPRDLKSKSVLLPPGETWTPKIPNDDSTFWLQEAEKWCAWEV